MQKKHLAVDLKTLPFIMTTKGDFKTIADNEVVLTVQGEIHYLGGFDKTFTGNASFKKETDEKFSGTLNIEEFGLKSEWSTVLSQTDPKLKVTGMLMNQPFNIDIDNFDHSTYDINNDQSANTVDLQYKYLAHIPAVNVDFVYLRSFYFSDSMLKSSTDLKLFSHLLKLKANHNIEWEFGKDFEAMTDVEYAEKFNISSQISSKKIDEARKITVKIVFFVLAHFVPDSHFFIVKC